MRVNLERLREARQATVRTRSDVIAIDEASIAVLEAPRVWWCADFQAGGKDEGTFPEDGTCTICGSNPANKGCGWTALVPVEGE